MESRESVSFVEWWVTWGWLLCVIAVAALAYIAV